MPSKLIDRVNHHIAEATGLPLEARRFSDDYYLCVTFDGSPRTPLEQKAATRLADAHHHCFYLQQLGAVPVAEWGTRAVRLLETTSAQ